MKSGRVTQTVKLCDWLNDIFSSWSHSSLLAKVIGVLQEEKKKQKSDYKLISGWKDMKHKTFLARNSLFISSWLIEKPFVTLM